MYVLLPDIDGALSFIRALADHSALYTETGSGVANGFDPMLGITTLEEYFSWMKTLGSISRKYTMLPLDEPHFIINTNTRAITIPADFKKNGIAVQGDDLAEVLYFEVDRYFDYMDLNNCDIFIQWETPKGTDGTVVRSASREYVRDIESQPGKLIFGWMIDDTITKNAGTLKFSVRFYQWNDDEGAQAETERLLAYSLSTLTAQVPIQPSINFNPEIDPVTLEDAGDRIIGRLENSVIVGGYFAESPLFFINLLEQEYDYNPDEKQLQVLAYSPDTGSISYEWKKQDLNEKNTTEGCTIYRNLDSIIEWVDVDKTQPLSEDIDYWIKQGTGHTLLTDRTLSDEQKTDDSFIVQTKRSCHVIQPNDKGEVAGVYWAVAENRITNATNTAESVRAVFPRPKDIKVTKAPATTGIIRDGKCVLSVEVEEASSDIQEKTYQWRYCANSELNFGELAEGEEIVWVDAEGDDAKLATYEAKEEGHYQVIVTNTRNLAKKVWPNAENPAIITRVTLPAQMPIIKELPAEKAKSFQYKALSDSNCPYVELDGTVKSDEYDIEWFHYEGDSHTPIVKFTIDPKKTLICKFNPKAYENQIINATTEKDLDGSYYAIVTNKLNGDKIETPVPQYEKMFQVTY